MIKSLTYQGAVFAGASALALLSPAVATTQTVTAAQTIDCAVVDEGGAGVPYANVYARDIDAGTVTDAAGAFSLPVYAAPGNTPVSVSCIGYADYATTLDSLRAPGGCPVALAPTDYALTGAEVRATPIAYTRERTYGVRVRRSIGGADFIGSDEGFDEESGFEIGNHMEVKAPWALESIRMPVRDFEGDSVLLEFNVYAMGETGPAARLHDERIFHVLRDGDERIDVDLADLGIYGEDDFLVTMELLAGLDEGERFGFPVRLWRSRTLYKTPAGEWGRIKVASLGLSATVRSAE